MGGFPFLRGAYPKTRGFRIRAFVIFFRELNVKKSIFVTCALTALAVLAFSACDSPTRLAGNLAANDFGVRAPRNVETFSLIGEVFLRWQSPDTPVSAYTVARKIKGADGNPVVVWTGQALFWSDTILSGPNKLVNGGVYEYTVSAAGTNTYGVGAPMAAADPVEVTVKAPDADTAYINDLFTVPVISVASSVPVSDAANANVDLIFKITRLDPAFSYTAQTYVSSNNGASWTSGGPNLSSPSPFIPETRDASYDGDIYASVTNFAPAAGRIYKVLITFTASGGIPYKVDAGTISSPADPLLNRQNKRFTNSFSL
jgi:hypothetical protein